MRIAHLIAHAESVPHCVPSLSRWLLCASATREIYYQKKTQCSNDSDIQMMGEGNMKQNRGGWENKSAKVLVKISDNTTKTLKYYFFTCKWRSYLIPQNKPGRCSALGLLQNPCVFILAKFCTLTLRFPVRILTSYCFTRSFLNTALERVPQAKTSCLHLLSRGFRLLQSTGDCLWVLNALAMPLTFLLPTIYLAHTHTLDPTYQFCTSSVSVCPASASHSNWNGARGQGRRNLGQWLHLDLRTISLLHYSCLCLNLPVPQGKTASAQPQRLGPAGT